MKTSSSTRLARFTRMEDGTREDYELIGRLEAEYHRGLADRVLKALLDLEQGQFGYQVDRLEHSLQTATRAQRDGADEEMVVCALLHDLGDQLAPHNHSAYAAAILQPFVSADACWVVEKHDLFQTYYYGQQIGEDRNGREKYRDHSCFEKAEYFCERWDQTSFDPDYDTLPLETFEPMVRRIFAREPWQEKP